MRFFLGVHFIGRRWKNSPRFSKGVSSDVPRIRHKEVFRRNQGFWFFPIKWPRPGWTLVSTLSWWSFASFQGFFDVFLFLWIYLGLAMVVFRARSTTGRISTLLRRRGEFALYQPGTACCKTAVSPSIVSHPWRIYAPHSDLEFSWTAQSRWSTASVSH